MSTVHQLMNAMRERILIIDGAMGSLIQQYDLTASDFGGENLEGCNEHLVLTRPDVIEEIHHKYLDAGADIIETNTFGATPLVLEEYGLEDKAYEINVAAARIARRASDQFPETYVAGSVGPTTKSLVVTQDISFEDMQASYFEQIKGLLDGGVDLIFVETIHDSLNVKAALHAINKAVELRDSDYPVFLSSSMAMSGRMLAGQDIEAFFATFSSIDIFAIGMNCAVGPKDLFSEITTLSQITELPTFMYPNAGLPDEHGEYNETPESFATYVENYAKNGLLNIVGSCCGSDPEFTREMRKRLDNIEPRQLPDIPPKFIVSGVEPVTQNERNRIILVGERANVQGSRKFKKLIRAGDFEQALEVVKQQVKARAQILDICLEDTEFNEVEAINTFYPLLSQATKLPIMIDSTDPEAVEAALKHTQGKSIINSINLEAGLDKLEKLVQLMKQYGAAAVVGVIDEEGMALTLERKIEVADRLYRIMVEEYDIPPEDIIFDLLVFTVDSGDSDELKGTAQATLDAITEVKKRYPKVSTVLGISNISFGLPPTGRQVLNSVYFHKAVEAGLDLAIVNPAHIINYAKIPDEELELAEKVLKHQDITSLKEFSNYFRDTDRHLTMDTDEDLPADESLHKKIIYGNKKAVKEDLDTLLGELTPLEIINTIIMDAMGEVGELFDQAKMIVTEVLQSAEVVKLAISHLEPLMLTGESYSKKKVLLATVKGDVHDIGKNLVRIILESNGYAVVDLGIRIDSQQLVTEIENHQPDAIGLSGLLVKSSRYMVTVAEHFKSVNIDLPLLLGGAALTAKFVENDVKPVYEDVFYAKDAMTGLSIVNGLFDEGGA